MKIFLKTTAVILLLLSAFNIHNSAFSQNVGINPTGATPDISAMLDVVSTSKGMLIPRVSLTSLTDAATIATPAASLMVYNTNAALTGGTGYYYNAGTTVSPLWVKLLNTGAGTAAADAWLTKGNSGTAWNTNFIGTTDNVSLRFRTNNTQKMIIDSSGNVGIGTTTPTVKLEVVDNNPAIWSTVLITKSNAAGMALSCTSAGPGGSYAMYGVCSGTGGGLYAGSTGGGIGVYGASTGNYGVFGITSSASSAGVFGISSNASIWGALGYNATWAYYGNGNSFTSGTFSSSDARWKDNVKTISNPLDIVGKLRGVYFTWNNSFPAQSTNEGRQLGFIAQEVEKVLPELVKVVDKEGHMAVAYDKIAPILIEGMKEQQKQIESQQKTIDNLKAEIEKIKSMLSGGVAMQ